MLRKLGDQIPRHAKGSGIMMSSHQLKKSIRSTDQLVLGSNDRGIAGSRMNFVNETSSVLDISSNTIL